MQKLFILLFAMAFFTACTKTDMDHVSNSDGVKTTGTNPKADSLQKMLRKYTAKGIPGAVVAIKDANGLWMGAEGHAKLEDQTVMTPTLLQYGYSINKTITAIAVMQLKEKGLIELDQPIRNYLPEDLYKLVPQTDVVTVRMLLNQTSGYSDYTDALKFKLGFLDNPLKVWKRAELYEIFRKNVTVMYTPGAHHTYSNTNYYLLSIIIDHITGRPHGEWFQKQIFDKLSLSQMYYKHSSGYPFYTNMPNTYWPRFGTDKLENNTRMQQAYMQNEIYGEDGVIASPDNYIRLIEGLVTGKLMNVASFQEMQQWASGYHSEKPEYGLGIGYHGNKGKTNLGHSGGGIGGQALWVYFPDSKTYLFFAANATVEFGGPVDPAIYEFMNELKDYLAGF